MVNVNFKLITAAILVAVLIGLIIVEKIYGESICTTFLGLMILLALIVLFD